VRLLLLSGSLTSTVTAAKRTVKNSIPLSCLEIGIESSPKGGPFSGGQIVPDFESPSSWVSKHRYPFSRTTTSKTTMAAKIVASYILNTFPLIFGGTEKCQEVDAAFV